MLYIDNRFNVSDKNIRTVSSSGKIKKTVSVSAPLKSLSESGYIDNLKFKAHIKSVYDDICNKIDLNEQIRPKLEFDTMGAGAAGGFDNLEGKIYFDDKFLKQLSDKTIVFAIRHELQHVKQFHNMVRMLGIEKFEKLMACKDENCTENKSLNFEKINIESIKKYMLSLNKNLIYQNNDAVFIVMPYIKNHRFEIQPIEPELYNYGGIIHLYMVYGMMIDYQYLDIAQKMLNPLNSYILKSTGGCLSLVDQALVDYVYEKFKDTYKTTVLTESDYFYICNQISRDLQNNAELALLIIILKKANNHNTIIQKVNAPKKLTKIQNEYWENIKFICQLQEGCYGSVSEQISI